MKKIVCTALFYTPVTWQKIKKGILTDDDCDDMKFYYHRDILLDLENIESANPSDDEWMTANYTDVRMKSGDRYMIKLSLHNLARITEHIDANKLICKLLN